MSCLSCSFSPFKHSFTKEIVSPNLVYRFLLFVISLAGGTKVPVDEVGVSTSARVLVERSTGGKVIIISSLPF